MEKLKILIVDDEQDAIEYVKAVLESLADFEFIEAVDGLEGIDAAREHKPDLIILDVMMPRMDGFKVFYELRKETVTKHIPVIMLTGVAEKAGITFFKKDMKNFLGSEPFDYIEKPLNPEKFTQSIKKVFELV